MDTPDLVKPKVHIASIVSNENKRVPSDIQEDPAAKQTSIVTY